jgi:hypothetical protein
LLVIIRRLCQRQGFEQSDQIPIRIDPVGLASFDPGIAPRVGLVLPINLCRDKKVRTTLLEIPALIDGAKNITMSDRRRAVEPSPGSARRVICSLPPTV